MIGYKEAKIRIMSVPLLFKPVASSKSQAASYKLQRSYHTTHEKVARSKRQEASGKRNNKSVIFSLVIYDVIKRHNTKIYQRRTDINKKSISL
jgi:hypothetical protein